MHVLVLVAGVGGSTRPVRHPPVRALPPGGRALRPAKGQQLFVFVAISGVFSLYVATFNKKYDLIERFKKHEYNFI